MNKVVLITGSSRGIGKAVAIAFAQTGCTVVINSSAHKEQLENTLTEIRRINKNTYAYLCDVSDFSEVQKMISECEAKYGPVDVLINNAGIACTGLFQSMTEEERRRVINVNVHGVFNTTHCVVNSMVKRHSGTIVNISSIWGNAGGSCEAVYSASKGAVNAFTKALGKELAPAGIRVNAVSCGCIDTKMNNNLSEEEKTALSEEIPIGRFGTSLEVAQAVLFLASEKSSYITGQILTVDGGFL